jgi:hypothetical protein
MKFVVLDIDDVKNTRIEAQDLIGETECCLAEIVTARGSLFNREIVHPQSKKRNGVLVVRSEETTTVDAMVGFNIRAMNLDKKDWFGSSGMSHALG